MKRLTWDEYFGAIVQLISLRSDDEETKTSAIIVDSKNRIVSTGYNGTPRGTNLPKTRPDKYPFMCHAEENALLYAKGDLNDCRIYILGIPPCNVCTRMLIQKGIKEIIIVNSLNREGGKDWNFDSTFKMIEQANIKYRKIVVPKVNFES